MEVLWGGGGNSKVKAMALNFQAMFVSGTHICIMHDVLDNFLFLLVT